MTTQNISNKTVVRNRATGKREKVRLHHEIDNGCSKYVYQREYSVGTQDTQIEAVGEALALMAEAQAGLQTAFNAIHGTRVTSAGATALLCDLNVHIIDVGKCVFLLGAYVETYGVWLHHQWPARSIDNLPTPSVVTAYVVAYLDDLVADMQS